MKPLLLLPLVAIAVAGCHTPEGDAWDRAHHVGEINWTGTPGRISTSPPEPAPQRPPEQPHAQQSSGSGSGMPDLSRMSCTGSSNVAQGANAGMMTSSTSCHN
jgi:hypothetical protein